MSASAKIVKGILRLQGRLPLRFHYVLADIICWMMTHLLHYRRDTIVTNLARSFPKMHPWEIRDLSKEFYRHIGEVIAEAVWMGGCRDLSRLSRQGIIKITNPETVQALYDSSPGVMVMATHCGNWELSMGLVCDTQGSASSCLSLENIVFVYKRLSSPMWNEVITSNRTAPFKGEWDGMVDADKALRFSLQKLRAGERKIYFYISDQCPYVTWKPIGEFLHQRTIATMGPAALACKSGMSVVYQKFNRVERGKYEITYIPICQDASKTTPEAVVRRYYDLLQEEIEQNPANWLWSHRRWKRI